jgi:hypothetical protein
VAQDEGSGRPILRIVATRRPVIIGGGGSGLSAVRARNRALKM